MAAPQAKLIRLKAPPVVGAVLLGMEQAGRDCYRVREKLIRTTNVLMMKKYSKLGPPITGPAFIG
jgi:hypothetical protein